MNITLNKYLLLKDHHHRSCHLRSRKCLHLGRKTRSVGQVPTVAVPSPHSMYLCLSPGYGNRPLDWGHFKPLPSTQTWLFGSKVILAAVAGTDAAFESSANYVAVSAHEELMRVWRICDRTRTILDLLALFGCGCRHAVGHTNHYLGKVAC